MKLCFVWVSEFKGFKNLSLNLSSEFEFNYDSKEKLLTKGSNDDFYSGLFDEGIHEITAIVGKNGMGKSNCLELICTLVKGSLHQLNVDFISVIEDDGEFYITKTSSEEIKIDFPYSDFEIKGKTKGLNAIFFSNIYDNRFYNFSRDVINVTARNNYGYGKYRKIKSRGSLFSSQISLISKHKENLERYVDLKVPESIFMEVSINSSLSLLNLDYGFISAFRKRLNGIVLHDKKIICSLRFLFLTNLLTYINDYESDSLNSMIKFEENESTEGFLLNKIEELIQHIASMPNETNIKDGLSDLKKITKDWSLLRNIERNIEHLLPEAVNGRNRIPGTSTYKMKYNPKDDKLIRQLCEIFSSTRGVDFIWDGISSGSNAFLNLLTVLNDELNGTRNDTLICIDEGDLYLHPAWQIDFISILNKMLPNFFTGKIQLVLTTHSPFLLTDLPRDNVILLDNNKVVSKDKKNLKTFGSNLYELYQNAFFLNKQRFGTLASEHIKEVTDRIVAGNLSQSEEKRIRKFISLIGDKLLHNQLNGMINND